MALTRPAGNQAEALTALKTISGIDIVNRETGIHAQINRTQRDKLVSAKAREKSNKNGLSNSAHFHAVANIDALFENASLVDDRADRDNNPDILSIKRFVAPVMLDGEFAEAYITVKETTGSKIYSLELDELKKPSDIQGSTLPKDRYYIPEGYHKILQKIEKARDFLKKYTKNPAGNAGNTGEAGTDGHGSVRIGTEDGKKFSVRQTQTPEFKRWFKDSKVVDQDGKPLVVYHGTNWDPFVEEKGDAAFREKHIGGGSGDTGFFGRGFYFTFGNGQASKAEAGFYGKNVYPFFLSIQNPFYFNETLRRWDGKRLFGDEVSSVEIVNAVKLFPELLGDYTLQTYDGNG